MDLLLAYLPQDRRRALATGVPLPDRCTGTVLFADIASFTALGEALSQTLGSRQGAEVLIDQINAVYTALIATVDQYGGSVIGFAGDSITCWFDDHAHPGAAAPGAVACALAQQVAMRAFADLPHPAGGGPLTLGLKTAVASGPARRFLVGDPAIQVIDVLAGTTLLRLAQGAHLARQGEIVLDTATLDALGQEGSMVAEWRADPRTGEHFAVCHPTLPLPAATEPGVHPPSPSPRPC